MGIDTNSTKSVVLTGKSEYIETILNYYITFFYVPPLFLIGVFGNLYSVLILSFSKLLPRNGAIICLVAIGIFNKLNNSY